MADESGSGTTTLDRVRRRSDERSDVDKLLYRDPEEPPSLYRQWTWREVFDSPLEFLRSFAMRSGDKPTKENVEESMASGGPVSSGALGKFGGVLRGIGPTIIDRANEEELLHVARKFYPKLMEKADDLPDIGVRINALKPGAGGFYTYPNSMSKVDLRESPGGLIDIRTPRRPAAAELTTLAHEAGGHAMLYHEQPNVEGLFRGVPMNLTDEEVRSLIKDYVRTGDLTGEIVALYEHRSPSSALGLRHVLVDGMARRLVREHMQGLPNSAYNTNLEGLERLVKERGSAVSPNIAGVLLGH